MSQQNLETVMIHFFGALGRADFEAAAELLDPYVTWQGVREDLVCQGREEVVDTSAGDSRSAARSTRSSSSAAATGPSVESAARH